jgi:hypothetical protein
VIYVHWLRSVVIKLGGSYPILLFWLHDNWTLVFINNYKNFDYYTGAELSVFIFGRLFLARVVYMYSSVQCVAVHGHAGGGPNLLCTWHVQSGGNVKLSISTANSLSLQQWQFVKLQWISNDQWLSDDGRLIVIAADAYIFQFSCLKLCSSDAARNKEHFHTCFIAERCSVAEIFKKMWFASTTFLRTTWLCLWASHVTKQGGGAYERDAAIARSMNKVKDKGARSAMIAS